MTWLPFLLLIYSADFEKPKLAHAENQLQFHLPEPLLSDAEVERRLLSGLTTSIIIETEARTATGKSFNDSLILEIRYDLWEETLTLGLVSKGGRAEKQVYSGLEDLLEAMRKEPRGIMTLPNPPPGMVQVRTRLRVIPYSQSEEDAAKSWIGDILTTPAEGTNQQDRGRQRTTGSTESGSEIFQVLMSSGLKRDAVVDVRWKWRLTVGQP
jgi:hypothetical protein